MGLTGPKGGVMSEMLKRVGIALAAKEMYERFQEKRQPKQSFAQRNSGKLALLAIGGGAFFLYRSGKLMPLIKQAKALTRRVPDAGSGVSDLTGTPQTVLRVDEPEGTTTGAEPPT
jgi:hypothetical protein